MNRGTWRSLGLLLLLGGAGCAPHPAQPVPTNVRQFVGTWRLVSGTYTQPGGQVVSLDSARVNVLKVIGPTHFAYVTEAEGPRFVRAGAGTFTVANGKYSETLQLTSADNMRGNTYSFDYRFDGDTWYHTGEVNGTRIEEVYRRVK